MYLNNGVPRIDEAMPMMLNVFAHKLSQDLIPSPNTILYKFD